MVDEGREEQTDKTERLTGKRKESKKGRTYRASNGRRWVDRPTEGTRNR